VTTAWRVVASRRRRIVLGHRESQDYRGLQVAALSLIWPLKQFLCHHTWSMKLGEVCVCAIIDQVVCSEWLIGWLLQLCDIIVGSPSVRRRIVYILNPESHHPIAVELSTKITKIHCWSSESYHRLVTRLSELLLVRLKHYLEFENIIEVWLVSDIHERYVLGEIAKHLRIWILYLCNVVLLKLLLLRSVKSDAFREAPLVILFEIIN
jgi:hypothetical protein